MVNSSIYSTLIRKLFSSIKGSVHLSLKALSCTDWFHWKQKSFPRTHVHHLAPLKWPPKGCLIVTGCHLYGFKSRFYFYELLLKSCILSLFSASTVAWNTKIVITHISVNFVNTMCGQISYMRCLCKGMSYLLPDTLEKASHLT